MPVRAGLPHRLREPADGEDDGDARERQQRRPRARRRPRRRAARPRGERPRPTSRSARGERANSAGAARLPHRPGRRRGKNFLNGEPAARRSNDAALGASRVAARRVRRVSRRPRRTVGRMPHAGGRGPAYRGGCACRTSPPDVTRDALSHAYGGAATSCSVLEREAPPLPPPRLVCGAAVAVGAIALLASGRERRSQHPPLPWAYRWSPPRRHAHRPFGQSVQRCTP
jgi:hypothetical protein